MVGFCAFFFVTLVEAFGTVGMGCDVFYFSLVTNTASLWNFTGEWLGVERGYSLNRVMKEEEIADDLK